MSTRCNIVVDDGNELLYLYHHHDGYPKGVGAELTEYLKSNNPQTAEELFNGLVFLYGDEYEETYGIHGDIEYLYKIDIADKKNVCLQCCDESENEIFKVEFDKSDQRSDNLTKSDIEQMTINVNATYKLKGSDIYDKMPAEVSITQEQLINFGVYEINKYLGKKYIPEYITIKTTLTNDSELND